MLMRHKSASLLSLIMTSSAKRRRKISSSEGELRATVPSNAGRVGTAEWAEVQLCILKKRGPSAETLVSPETALPSIGPRWGHQQTRRHRVCPVAVPEPRPAASPSHEGAGHGPAFLSVPGPPGVQLPKHRCLPVL